MLLKSRQHSWLLPALLVAVGVTVSLAVPLYAEPSIPSLREAPWSPDRAWPAADLDDAESVKETQKGAHVLVRHVKLQSDDPIEGAPTSTLVFDVYNDTGGSVTDVTVLVSLLDAAAGDSKTPRVLVGPFKIRLEEVLLADYSVHYELRLRNLSPDCGCVPVVDVLDARVFVDANLERVFPSR